MSKKKESRKNSNLEKVVLATALIKLVETLIELIKKFIE